MRTPLDPPRFAVATLGELAALLDVSAGKIQYVSRNLERFYRRKSTPKEDGTERVLWVPYGQLREIQDQIKLHILSRIRYSRHAHGGVKGRSVKSFVRPLAGRRMLLALDIKNCFPSISPERVRCAFASTGFAGDALALLVKLTTWNFELPQGPPTSPQIANMVLQRLDRRQSGLAKQHGAQYRRFVDDMGIAGERHLEKLKGLHERIVADEGFALKPDKASRKRLMDRSSDRQQILKVVINEKPNLPRERRKKIVGEISATLKAGADVSNSQLGRLSWLRFINPQAATRVQLMVRKGRKK